MIGMLPVIDWRLDCVDPRLGDSKRFARRGIAEPQLKADSASRQVDGTAD